MNIEAVNPKDIITATCEQYNGGRRFSGVVQRVNTRTRSVIITTKNGRSTKAFPFEALNILSVLRFRNQSN